MPESKYGKLITTDIVQKSLHPEVTAPKLSFRGDIDRGTNFSFDWSCLSRPIDMRADSHAHDFDEFLIFTGTDPQDMKEFPAEVELCLGEDCEKYAITEPTVFYIPRGLRHCPLNFRRIDKPIAYWNIFFSPNYSLDVAASPKQSGKKAARSRYEKYVIRPAIRTRTLETKHYLDGKLAGKEKSSITEITYLGEGTAGGLTVHWYVVTEPLVMFEPPHASGGERYDFFLGGDAMNVREFAGEADIRLGEEAERHTIGATSLVHIPRGLVYGKIDFRRVTKPIMLMRLAISPA
jgi:hypothetical protein